MAREVVLSKMAIKTVYSQNGEVANDHNRYWTGFFGMYLLTGLAFRANSMQLRWKKDLKISCKLLFEALFLPDSCLRHNLGMQILPQIGR